MEKYGWTEKMMIGDITIIATDNAVIRLMINEKMEDSYIYKTNRIIEEAFYELREYFEGKRKKFDVPLQPNGTIFQQNVWKELIKIEYGDTKSYQDIAICLGNHKLCRAIGMANNKNPIPILIPCHRVIGKNKQLIGYRYGIEMKRRLLTLENKNKNSN